MSKENELITVEKNEIFEIKDQSVLEQMSQDAQEYTDDTDLRDVTIARLKLVQAMTPQVKKADPSYIKGLEEGDLLNTLTEDYFKGGEGVYIIPVKRRTTYIEWGDIKKGGGLKNNYGEDSVIFDKTPIDPKEGKRLTPEGNEIVRTHDVYVYMISKDLKKIQVVVISMSKSQEKSYRDWNALIRLLKDKKTGKQLPEYAGCYLLKTIPVSNDKGSWFSFKITFAGYTLALPEIGERIYKEAKEFNNQFGNIEIKVQDIESSGEFIDTPTDKI